MAGFCRLVTLFLFQGPCSDIVEYGFLEKCIVEGIDHIAVAAHSSDPKRRPNIFPRNKVRRSAVPGQH